MTEATSKLSPFASQAVLNFSQARFPRQFSNAIAKAISVTSATTANRIRFNHFIQQPPSPGRDCEAGRLPAWVVPIYRRQAQPKDAGVLDTQGPCPGRDESRPG